jgi:Kef-type K+ transport system membrane component KefB
MSLSGGDLTHLIPAAVLLLVAAHGLGRLFAWLRQPRVAGEILGGLLLGPTLFGLVAPDWQRAVFQGGATRAGLGIGYQLGLLLLMYCSGAELRKLLVRGESKPVLGIAVVGNAVPFLAGLAFVGLYDTGRFVGPAGDRLSFTLVFAPAIAVTSIPVISRIMSDLGILGSRFARIVLSVAVLEDLVIYVVLNIALARVAGGEAEGFSLPAALGIRPASVLGNGYYVVATLAFFLLPVVAGSGLAQRLADWRGNVLHRASPIAFQLVFMLVLAGLASFLGVAPIFGALVAGILAGELRGRDLEARQAITGVASAVMVPLYFAVVGLRLGPGALLRAAVLPVPARLRLPGQVGELLCRRQDGRGRQARRPQPGRGPQRPRRPRDRAGVGGPGRRHHPGGLLHHAGHAGAGHLGDRRVLAGAGPAARPGPARRGAGRRPSGRRGSRRR